MVKKFEVCGVSEVIGFILILGIMVTGIGLVTLYGYPILLQQQANANVKNMERNMISLQSDINSLTYKSIPYKETSMEISGGTLYAINPNLANQYPGGSYFSVTENGVPLKFNSTDPASTTFHPGLLEFDSDSYNAIIGLQNGAVVTNGFSQTGGSSMLSGPRWFLDDDPSTSSRTLVLNMIQINSSGSLSSNGIGTVQMSVSQLYPPQDITLSPSQIIKITYTDFDGYTTAWQDFFNNARVFTTTAPNPCSVSGTTLTIPNVNRLVIKSYKITILNL